MAKPLLRWAGSKRQLTSTLSEFWTDSHKRYVEPFAGSACLFFALEPEAAILGDINADLIHAYRQVCDHPGAVHDAYSSFHNTAEDYYRIRSFDPTVLEPHEQAGRFIYLNRYCFNGLYRTNLNGAFNVPYGGRKSGTLPGLDELEAVSERLSGVTLVAGDFWRVLRRTRPGDLVYLDPPYRVAGQRVFRQYDLSVFPSTGLKRLREWLVRLTSRGIEFVISYADSAEAKSLAKGFRFRSAEVRRNIAGFAGSRKRAKEILVTNRHLLGR